MRTITTIERRSATAPSRPACQGEADVDHPPHASTSPEPKGSNTPSTWGLPFTGLGSVPGSLWSDWRWQLRHRIRSVEELLAALPGLDADARGIDEAARRFPLAITPYYASLIRRADRSDPIFQMAVPQAAELTDYAVLKEDPLSEDDDMPVPGLIHRYPDRALLLATSACSVYCRHCTRKRVTGQREGVITSQELLRITEYLRSHPEIHDVIVSGGDPFTLATEVLEEVLASVRAVPSVDIIRIGTRTPVTLPVRIDRELAEMISRYHPVYVNTHFNHPAELTDEAIRACSILVDAGIPMGNQTVLLRGVNDSPQVLETLFRSLLRNRVRPYYLFQCDLVRGVEHFRTPLSKGIEIMEYLRGRLSGMAIPTFVVDAPNGGGKIPLLPNYIVSMSPTHTVLRNFEGLIVSYPEPMPQEIRPAAEPSVPAVEAGGVWEVMTGRRSHLQPKNTERERRRRIAHPQSLTLIEN